MATKCANCGSYNTQAHVNSVGCLDCGKLSDFEGNPVANGMDDGTRELLLSKMGVPTTNVVGNLADVQRGGAAVLKDEGSISTGVEAPPGTSTESIKAEADAAEKVDAALADAAESITASTDTSGDGKKSSKK